MLDDTQENKLYIDALKTLEKHGRVSDHHKVATSYKEIDFMHDVNHVMSTVQLQMTYKPGQYEKIFCKGE